MSEQERPEPGTEFAYIEEDGSEVTLTVKEVLNEVDEGIFTVTAEEDEEGDVTYDIAFDEDMEEWRVE